MPVRTRRWNDPKQPDDGFRLLICRYRPRALPKADETWDAWWAALGPSRELHAAYYGKNGPPIGLAAYVPRYLAEMEGQRALIDQLATRVAAGETITLLCSSACNHPGKCHRMLLKKLIEDRVAAVRP